jgi:putative flippase GtrA
MILALSIKARAARAMSSGLPSLPHLPVFLKDLVGYGLCSAAALALDCGLLLGLTQAGLNYLPAAAIGFFTGMMLAYFLSIRFVYANRRSSNHAWEAFGFFIIGIAGLVLNQILLFGFVDGLDLSLGLAKGVTALCVFLFNFGARRSVLFSPAAPRHAPEQEALSN